MHSEVPVWWPWPQTWPALGLLVGLGEYGLHVLGQGCGRVGAHSEQALGRAPRPHSLDTASVLISSRTKVRLKLSCSWSTFVVGWQIFLSVWRSTCIWLAEGAWDWCFGCIAWPSHSRSGVVPLSSHGCLQSCKTSERTPEVCSGTWMTRYVTDFYPVPTLQRMQSH